MRSLTRKALSLLLCFCIIGTSLFYPAIAAAVSTPGQLHTDSPNPYYSVGQTFRVIVEDADLSLQGNVTVQVQSSNQTSPSAISVDLTEETMNPGRFVGFLKIADQNNDGANPPEITGAIGDIITITYSDSDPSQEVKYFITVAERVEAPTAQQLEDGSVVLSNSTLGSTIYYTTDGSDPRRPDPDPNNQSTPYTGPISISVPTQIKAIAVADSMADSEIVAFRYNYLPVQVVAPDGVTPVQNARVELYDEFGNFLRSENIDNSGIAYFDPTNLPGKFIIRAFPDSSSAFAANIGQTVENYSGENIKVKLTDSMFTGTVKKPDGSDVTDGWLSIDKYFDEYGTQYLFGVPVQNGIYKLPPLGEGKYKLRANPSEIDFLNGLVSSNDVDITVSNTNTITDPSPDTINLVLNNAQFSGIVTNPSGNPAYGHEYNIQIRPAQSRDDFKYVWNNFDSTYKVGGLQDGDYLLIAESKNPLYTNSFVKPFNITNGVASLTTIDLQLTNPQITGIVVEPTESATPVNGGRVEVLDPVTDAIIADFQVGPDGTFKIGGIAPGDYKLRAYPQYPSEYIISDRVPVTITENPQNLTISLKQKQLTVTRIDSYEKGNNEIRVKLNYTDIIGKNFSNLTAEISGNGLISPIVLPYSGFEGFWGPDYTEADVMFAVGPQINLDYGTYTLTIKDNSTTPTIIAAETSSLNVIQWIKITPNVVQLSDYKSTSTELTICPGEINGNPQNPVWSSEETLKAQITANVGEPVEEFFNDVALGVDNKFTIPAVTNAVAGNRTVKLFRGNTLIAQGGFDIGDARIDYVYSKEGSNEVIVSGEYLESYKLQNATAEVWLGESLIDTSTETKYWGELAFRFSGLTFEPGPQYILKIYLNSQTTPVDSRSFVAMPRLDIVYPVVAANEENQTLTISEGSNSALWSATDSLKLYINGENYHYEATVSSVEDNTITLNVPSMPVGDFGIDIIKGTARIGFAEFIVDSDNNVIIGTVVNADGGYVNIHKVNDDRWGERVTIGHDGKFYLQKSRLNVGDGDYDFIAVPVASSIYASNKSTLTMSGGVIADGSINITLPEKQISGTVYTEGTVKATRGNVDLFDVEDNYSWITGAEIYPDGTYKLSGLIPNKKYAIVANPSWEDDYLSSEQIEVTYVDTLIDGENLTFSKPQVIGSAFDFSDKLLDGDKYNIFVRSQDSQDTRWESKAKNGYFLIGKLPTGKYNVSISPRVYSEYTHSLEKEVVIDKDGVANPESISLKYSEAQYTGTAIDINGDPLVSGYVEVYDGTWENPQYICWVPVDKDSGAFGIGGLPAGDYYIRANVGDDSSQYTQNGPSAMTLITIGTTTGVELQLTDKSKPRIKFIRDGEQGSDRLEVRLYNFTDSMISGMQVEVLKADGTSLEPQLIISNTGMSKGWYDENSGEGDLQILSDALRSITAGNYKLKLTYTYNNNSQTVLNDSPNGDSFKVVTKLRLNPYVILPGTTGITLTIGPENENDTVPWTSNDTLQVKLVSDNGTEYLLTNSIDATDPKEINATLSEALAQGGYSVEVYKGAELLGRSHLEVGTPVFRGIYDITEDNGSVRLYGDYLDAYNGAVIQAKIYQGTSTTPIFTSSDYYFDWGTLNIKINSTSVMPGNYRLELTINGTPVTLPNNGAFRVIDLLYATPGYLLENQAPSEVVTLNALTGRTPWAETADNIFLVITNEKTGNKYVVEPVAITVLSSTSLKFTWPEFLADAGRCSIVVVLNQNDPDNRKSVGYAILDIIGQTQLTGQITDTSDNPVPYARIFVGNGFDWGMDFTADSNGNYAIYGLKPGNYKVWADAPNGKAYIGAEPLEITINEDLSCSVSSPKDFVIVPAKVISGTISLPGTEKAPKGGVNVWIDAVNEDDDSWYNTGIVIDEGYNSYTYNILVPQSSASYIIRMRSDAAGIMNSNIFYSSAITGGSVLTQAEATEVAVNGSDVSSIDMTLMRGNNISGTISLPDELTSPAGGIAVNAIVVRDNNNEEFRDDIFAKCELYIPQGESSTDFTLNLPAKSGYKVIYEVDKSSGFLPEGYYQGSTTTFRWESATSLDLTSAVSGVDLTLIPAKKISGTISLPEAAPLGGLYGLVQAWNDQNTPMDEKDDYFFTEDIWVEQGQNSANYSILVPLDNYYRVLTQVKGNGLIDGVTLYSSKGSVYNATNADVIDLSATGEQSKTANIMLAKGITISGTITLPQAVSEDRLIRIHAFADKDTSGLYDDVDAMVKMVIEKGNSSVQYSINVPSGESYRVEYLADPAYNYEDKGFYSSTGTVFDYGSASVIANLSANIAGINLNVSNRLSLGVVNAEVLNNGDAIKLTFNKPLDMATIPVNAAGNFSVSVGSDSYAITGITANDNEIILTLDEAYKIFGDYKDITVSYDGTAGIYSLDDMELPAISNRTVMNNSSRTFSIVTNFADGALLNKDAIVKVTTSGENIIIKEAGNVLVSKVTTAGYVFQNDGKHTITVSVSGRKNDTVLTFEIDKTAPIIEITGAANAVNNHDGVKPVVEITGVAGTDYEPASKVVTLNGQAYDGSAITKAGKYAITASVKDKAGNVGTATTSFEVSWDTTAPKIAVTGVENGKTYESNPVIGVELTSTATSNSNLTNYYFKGTLKKPDGTVVDFDKSSIPTIAAEGKYRLEVLAVNPSYNDITSNSVVEFTVDNVAPTVSISNVTDNKVYNTSVTPVINLVDSIASQQTLLANATIKMTKDGIVVPYYAGSTISDEGTYRLEVSTKDAFGHSSNTAAVNFKIDKVKPVITITGALNGYTYKDLDVPVTIKANEGTLTVTNNGTPVTLDSNGQVTFKADANSTAVVKLVVKAVDEAVNTTEQQLIFTIDRLAVNIVVNGISDGVLLNTNPVIKYTTYEGSVEKTGTTAEIDDVAFASGTTYSQAGNHTMVISFTSGNQTYTKTLSFTIDKSAPAVGNITVQKNGASAASATYVKAGDSIKVKADISEQNGISEVSFSLGAAVAAVPMKYSEAGYYEGEFIVGSGSYPEAVITVIAKDKAGNSTSQTLGTINVTVDNTKPTVSAVTNPTVADGKNGIFRKEGMKVNLTAGATDTIQYNLNGNSDSAVGSKALTPAQGTNILVYKAVDLAGNVSDEKVIVFQYDSDSPSNVELDTTSGTTVNTQTIAVSGTVPNEGGKAGSRVLLRKSTEIVAAANIKSDSKFVLDGIRLTEGQNSFTLTAVDLAGNESANAITFTVTLDSTAPIISVNKVDETHYTIKVNEAAAAPTVKFNGSIDNIVISEVQPTETGVVKQYNVETPAPIEGTNVLNVSSTDIAGNIGSGSYSSTFIPSTGQNAVPLSDNSTMDIPSGAFANTVQMLVKTVDTATNSTSYKPLGATVSYQFVLGDQNVEPDKPLVIRNFIGAGLSGVALMHVDNNGNIGQPVIAEIKTSTEFDMNDPDTVNNVLGAFENGSAIYIIDTGYLVYKTSTFSGYTVVQDVTAPVISLSTDDFTINASDKEQGLMSIAGNLKVDSSAEAANDTTATITEVTVDGVVMDLSSIAASLKDNTFNIPLDLSDGTHEVTIKTADGAGNTSTLTRTYSVDATVPHITASVPKTSTNDSTIDVTLTTDEAVDVYFNTEFMGNFNGTSVIPYTLMDGRENRIQVYVEDSFGNSMMGQELSVTRDSVAPTIAISGISNNGIYGSGRSVSITVTDTMDQNPSYSVKIDGATYKPGDLYSVEGLHTLSVVASDSFGNTATTEMQFTIDTTVPVVNLTGVNSSEPYNTVQTLTISAANADELTVTKSIDGGTPETVTMGLTGGTLTLGKANEKHTYTIAVTAKKLTGNQLIATDSITLTVDMKAPVIISTTAAQTEAATINLTGTVDEISDIYLNGNKIIAENPAGNFTITGQNLNVGNNSFAIKAVDQAGNEKTLTISVERKQTTIPGGDGGFPGTVIPVIPETPKAEAGVISLKPVLTGNTASSTVTAEDISTAFEQATANAAGTKTINIQLEKVDGASAYAQEIPVSVMQEQNAKQNITIATPVATVTIPGDMFTAKELSSKKAIEIKVTDIDTSSLGTDIAKAVGNKPVIDISAAIDGKTIAWNNPGAPVTVSIDYKPTAAELKNPDHIVVWYIDGNGKIVSVPSGRYNAATGKVTFTTTHFSKYAVSYVNKTFSDISKYGWAKKQIEALAAKGIIGGTSATTFAPGVNITRADFMVLLMKALGLTAKVDSNFDDIKASDYYYEAVGIAKQLGITTGSGNNLFKPKEFITREDMMVLVNKALKLQNKITNASDSVLTQFADANKIASYAEQSAANLVSAGIVSGSGDKVNPKGYATRAEIAVIVYKIYNK